MRLIALAFSFGPVLFGIGLIAPAIASAFDLAGIAPPFGISPLHAGLGIGILLGLVARQRKTWLW
ncbi:hypothetical protein [Sphingorhabdus sp.]|uniref:hypothetical protein n=1 Tax=Sphingorhabdus sp. TaxID=1902408 RepID=UPI0035AF0F7A|nr:hypothetical protein [Sphingomonadaceae bacterium]